MSGRNSSLYMEESTKTLCSRSVATLYFMDTFLFIDISWQHIYLTFHFEWMKFAKLLKAGSIVVRIFKKKKRKRKPFLLFKIVTAKKPNNIFTSNWNLSLNEKEIARLQSQYPAKLSKKNFGRLLRENNETCRKTRMSKDCRLNWVSN